MFKVRCLEFIVPCSCLHTFSTADAPSPLLSAPSRTAPFAPRVSIFSTSRARSPPEGSLAPPPCLLAFSRSSLISPAALHWVVDQSLPGHHNSITFPCHDSLDVTG